MKKNLCISFSQQPGNACVQGDTEQDHCYTIAKALYDKLSITCSSELNLFIPMKLKENGLVNNVLTANTFFKTNGGSGYYLEIHSDAGGYGKGASALYVSDAGLVFMRDIYNAVASATPSDDIGLRRRTDLYALNATIVPAGIIELSFHDTLEGSKFIHDKTKVIDSLYSGIVKSLQLSPIIPKDVKIVTPVDISLTSEQEIHNIKVEIDRINAFLNSNFKNFK